jgi:hypothetical protein
LVNGGPVPEAGDSASPTSLGINLRTDIAAQIPRGRFHRQPYRFVALVPRSWFVLQHDGHKDCTKITERALKAGQQSLDKSCSMFLFCSKDRSRERPCAFGVRIE